MTITVELLHDDARRRDGRPRDPPATTSAPIVRDAIDQMLGRTTHVDAGAGGGHGRRLRPRTGRHGARIPLGFKARLPLGVEAQIRPRSGTTFKKGLADSERAGNDRLRFPRRVDGAREESDVGADSDRSRRADRADGVGEIRGAGDREWAGRGDDGSSRRVREHRGLTASNGAGIPATLRSVFALEDRLSARSQERMTDHRPHTRRDTASVGAHRCLSVQTPKLLSEVPGQSPISSAQPYPTRQSNSEWPAPQIAFFALNKREAGVGSTPASLFSIFTGTSRLPAAEL